MRLWAIIHQGQRLSCRREKTRYCPTIPSVFPLGETVILRIYRVKDGPSGNVSLDTICRVMRKMHSIVTKESLGGRLRAKNDDARKQEAAIDCAILNRMLEMGEPLSYAIG